MKQWKTLPNQHLFPNYKTLMFTFHSVRSLEVNEWIWDHRHHTSSSYESHNVSGAKFLYFLIFLPKLRQIETKCGVSPIICANLHLIGNVSEFTSVLGAYKLTTSYAKSVILPYFALSVNLKVYALRCKKSDQLKIMAVRFLPAGVVYDPWSSERFFKETKSLNALLNRHN